MGWQTVVPQSRDRLCHPILEEYLREPRRRWMVPQAPQGPSPLRRRSCERGDTEGEVPHLPGPARERVGEHDEMCARGRDGDGLPQLRYAALSEAGGFRP